LALIYNCIKKHDFTSEALCFYVSLELSRIDAPNDYSNSKWREYIPNTKEENVSHNFIVKLNKKKKRKENI
jgi:hypothetical protein